MKPGFHNTTLDVRTGDGLDDVLLEPLDYLAADGTLYRAPIGGTTDGLSVPRVVQNIIPPTGMEWFSGVIHDSAYRDQLLMIPANPFLTEFPDAGWVPAHLTQEQSDNLILEAMTSQGVDLLERELIYHALRVAGSVAFAEDRAAVKASI